MTKTVSGTMFSNANIEELPMDDYGWNGTSWSHSRNLSSPYESMKRLSFSRLPFGNDSGFGCGVVVKS